MEQFKVIEVKESIFADNNAEADRVRALLKEQGTFLLNLMSSPGGGKTTTLRATIAALKDELRMGVMRRISTRTWTPPPSPRQASGPSSSTPAACAIWTPA